MRKVFMLVVGIMSILMLVGCSSDSSPKVGTVKEISFEKLLKKFDERETFWLISLDAEPELIQKKQVIEDFERELKRQGLSAYYINIKELTDQEKDSLNKDYSHFEMGANGKSVWESRDDGLVYVKDGGIINFSDGVSFSDTVIERYDSMEKNIREKVEVQLKRISERGIEME